MTAGIVIVAYRSAGVIAECLDACRKHAPAAPVVVVDNEPCPRIEAETASRPGVRLIANAVNRGFAAAANQGIAACRADAVLLLNPDVRLESPIEALVDACASAGLSCGRLTGSDGRPQSGFMVRRLPDARALVFEVLGLNRLWPGNPVNRRFRCLDLDPDQPAEVEQPAGAFLMVRRDVWEELEGFDEGFFPLWFEDVDFCARARYRGYGIRYVPDVLGRHAGGHSARTLDWSCRQTYWYGSLLRWVSKHLRGPERVMVCVSVLLGSVPRGVYGVLRERNWKPAAACLRVIRMAFRCLPGKPQAAGVVSSARCRGSTAAG